MCRTGIILSSRDDSPTARPERVSCALAMERQSADKHDRAELEAMIAEAEAKSTELRPAAAAADPALRASRERASAVVMGALALTEADRSELDRLGQEHEAALRRFAFEAKERTIEASAKASRRLDALAGSERA